VAKIKKMMTEILTDTNNVIYHLKERYSKTIKASVPAATNPIGSSSKTNSTIAPIMTKNSPKALFLGKIVEMDTTSLMELHIYKMDKMIKIKLSQKGKKPGPTPNGPVKSSFKDCHKKMTENINMARAAHTPAFLRTITPLSK
jgi:hypothetical protein